MKQMMVMWWIMNDEDNESWSGLWRHQDVWLLMRNICGVRQQEIRGWIWNIGQLIELIATYKTSSFLALSYVLGYIILLDKKRKAMNAVGVYFADNYFRRIVNQWWNVLHMSTLEKCLGNYWNVLHMSTLEKRLGNFWNVLHMSTTLENRLGNFWNVLQMSTLENVWVIFGMYCIYQCPQFVGCTVCVSVQIHNSWEILYIYP